MPITFQHKPGLVAYITCGDPDLETSREVALAAIAAGADVLELGVPFSDPVADGPVIQAASDRALKNDVKLGDVLKLAADIRKQAPNAGLIVFSYFNPILRYGLERFCADAAQAGVDGALVTDLPVEEADDYIQLMRSRDLATVFLAAPTSTDERLKSVCDASTGFVYAVSRTGVTGVRQQLADRCGFVGRAPAAVHGVADRGRIWRIQSTAVRGGWSLRRCSRRRHGDCAINRAFWTGK